jgi:hypothetical protein
MAMRKTYAALAELALPPDPESSPNGNPIQASPPLLPTDYEPAFRAPLAKAELDTSPAAPPPHRKGPHTKARDELFRHLKAEAHRHFGIADYDPIVQLMKSSFDPKRSGRQRDWCSAVVAEYVHSKRKSVQVDADIHVLSHETWLQAVADDEDRPLLENETDITPTTDTDADE